MLTNMAKDSAEIADVLREMIRTGELQPGDRLPGENDLKDEYGVSRMTGRAAHKILMHEGLVESKQGAGVFVRHRKKLKRHGSQRYSRKNWRSSPVLGAEAASQGLKSRRDITKLATVPAPPRVADSLGVDEATDVWTRQRLVFVDDCPAQTADSYYPLDVVENTRLKETEGGGSDFAQLDDAGHTPTRIREEWSSRMPTPEESELLHLLPGTPVLDLARTIIDQDDRPVEVMIALIAADSAHMAYEFPVPD